MEDSLILKLSGIYRGVIIKSFKTYTLNSKNSPI